MLVAYPIFLAFAACVSAAPSRQERFDAVDPYDSFPNFPIAAAYAGAGFPFVNPWVPFFNPFQFPRIQFPRIEIPVIKPWYEGPNVCQTKKVFDAPDEVNQWMNEGFPDTGTYQQESQQCRGNNEKYVCMSRTQTPDGMKMELKKWACCFGFVRPNDGRSGCIETSDEQASNDAPSAGKVKTSIVRMNDKFKYSTFKDSSKGKSGVENVPIQ